MTNKIGCAILIPKKENRNEAIFMRKKMIGKACAAALIAGMMFAEGCGNAGGTDTENTALRKKKQIPRRRRMPQEKHNIH